MTQEEFLRISTYVKNKYGIDMSNKKEIVRGRLENHIKSGGWRNFKEFMNDVEKDRSGVHEKMLVNLLTTNYTYFMREFGHFEYLRTVVLPWIKTKESSHKEVRLWCGAASTGEEPYMLAMVLQEFFGLERSQWDLRLLATDVSTRALQQAMTGSMVQNSCKRFRSSGKKNFFKPLVGGLQYQVKDELKQQVLFRKFNLMDPFPFRKKMHVVFLRNVMIYFDEETKRELVQKVYDNLEPGGYLFVGMTETIDRGSTPFKIIQPSIFKKEGR